MSIIFSSCLLFSLTVLSIIFYYWHHFPLLSIFSLTVYHFPLLSIIFPYCQSFSQTVYHFPWLSIIFPDCLSFPWLSFSHTDYHFPLLSIIFSDCLWICLSVAYLYICNCLYPSIILSVQEMKIRQYLYSRPKDGIGPPYFPPTPPPLPPTTSPYPSPSTPTLYARSRLNV